MSYYDSSRLCCCNYVNYEKKICCFLNLRYPPIISALIKILNNEKNAIDNVIGIILNAFQSKPPHCLMNALIEIINQGINIKTFFDILNDFKGFYMICTYAVNYTVDVKLLCIELGIKISKQTSKEHEYIDDGIDILFSNLLVSKPRIPNRCNSSVDLNKVALRRTNSSMKLNEKVNSYPNEILNPEIKIIYKNLIKWMTKERSNLSPILWLTKLHKKTKNIILLKKILKHFEAHFSSKIYPKSSFEDKNIIDWLLTIETDIHNN